LGNTLRIELTEEMFVAHQQELDVNKQFIELFVSISNLSNNVKVDHYNLVFNQYINLGYSLGFDLDEIYQGYLEKNKVNYERQESNY
jgi:dimeric dUTPase (all-alpha-NTP-PPase superfamily)